MRVQSIIDCYVSASLGTPDEIADVASNLGLDAVLYVFHSSDEVPCPQAIAAANERGKATLHAALHVNVQGTRVVLLLPTFDDAPWEVLEETQDLALLTEAVVECEGALLPVAPHQGPECQACADVVSTPENHRTGWVAMVEAGSSLGRHLDLEDCSLQGRRVLGGTGPFATVDQVGRYATILPGSADSSTELIASLVKGLGMAVELRAAPRSEAPNKAGGRRRSRRRPRKKNSTAAA